MAHSYDTAEHDSSNSAKRVYIAGSGATINAVVNTSALGQASVVLDTGTKWIGLTTTSIGSAPTLYAVVNTSALGQASVVLDTGANWIGLATTSIGSAPTIYAVVNTSAVGQSSVVLDTGANWVGLATVSNGAGVAQIGSVTVSNLAPWSGYTVFSGTYSASGFNTVFVPQTNTHFYIKDLVLSSMATAYVGFKSGATNTPLMTTLAFNPAGGAVMNFGDSGLRSLATSDALVLDLQGSATVALMANVRFGN